MRSVCEQIGVPSQMAREEGVRVWRLRETQALIAWIRERGEEGLACMGLRSWLASRPDTSWNRLLRAAVDELEHETAGTTMAAAFAIEWFAEWARDARRRREGLQLLTAHRAKGLEFDHVIVLDGGWRRRGAAESAAAPRRLYYVAMTRARQTLALMQFAHAEGFQEDREGTPTVHRRSVPQGHQNGERHLSERRYMRLTLGDVYMDWAGRQPARGRERRALTALQADDPLKLRAHDGGWSLMTADGAAVGRLARSFRPPRGMRCVAARAVAIVTRRLGDVEPEHRRGLPDDTWEVVVPELVSKRPGRRRATYRADECRGATNLEAIALDRPPC